MRREIITRSTRFFSVDHARTPLTYRGKRFAHTHNAATVNTYSPHACKCTSVLRFVAYADRELEPPPPAHTQKRPDVKRVFVCGRTSRSCVRTK